MAYGSGIAAGNEGVRLHPIEADQVMLGTLDVRALERSISAILGWLVDGVKGYVA